MADSGTDGLIGLRIDVRSGVAKIFATVSREGIPLLRYHVANAPICEASHD